MQDRYTDLAAEDFQTAVEATLSRNTRLLDTLTKYQTASARLSRAVVKAATQCGCISLATDPEDPRGFTGSLCKSCREVIDNEMGDALYYMAALAGSLDTSLMDVLLKEKQHLQMMGRFSLK